MSQTSAPTKEEDGVGEQIEKNPEADKNIK